MDRSTKLRLAGIILCIVGSMLGCATARPVAPEVESVGTLAPAYNSVAVAPVHAGTDLSPAGFVAADSDADASPTVADGGGAAELPELSGKTGGLKMGGAK